jgi:hypothetical protein
MRGTALGSGALAPWPACDALGGRPRGRLAPSHQEGPNRRGGWALGLPPVPPAGRASEKLQKFFRTFFRGPRMVLGCVVPGRRGCPALLKRAVRAAVAQAAPLASRTHTGRVSAAPPRVGRHEAWKTRRCHSSTEEA